MARFNSQLGYFTFGFLQRNSLSKVINQNPCTSARGLSIVMLIMEQDLTS